MGKQGGCLCGQVRYEIHSEPLASAICHCKNCQKQSGAAFSINVVVPTDQIDLKGKLTTFVDQSEEGNDVLRKFCSACGSPILSELSSMLGMAAIKVCTLDDPSSFDPQMQIWCSSQQGWHDLKLEIPKFPKNPSQ